MSVSLQNYFQLGIDSTNNPVNQSLQNTIITPVDTKSTHLNRCHLKFQKLECLHLIVLSKFNLQMLQEL